ncbi:MAG: hypothetical protein ACHQ53_03695 [Polyangiales bacterium]
MQRLPRFSYPTLAFALLSVCTAGSLGCTASGTPAAASASDLPRAGEPDAKEQSCWRDTECVLVEDCCGCARGGLRTGVRSDSLSELEQRSASTCEQHTCSDQPSHHRSCSATASRCLGGRCVPTL